MEKVFSKLKTTEIPEGCLKTRMMTQVNLTQNFIKNKTNIKCIKNLNDINLQVNVNYTNTELYDIIMKLAKILTVYIADMNNQTVIERCEEMNKIFSLKNSDYGNSYKYFGIVGLIVRMQDKINRFMALLNKNANYQEDTVGDLNLYCVILLSELEEQNLDVMIEFNGEID